MRRADEGGHPAPSGQLVWEESWAFDFVLTDALLAGYLRLTLRPAERRAWYWAALVGDGRPLVSVVDLDVDLPRAGSFEIRAEGLWADHTCETPFEHWSAGLEAFAVGYDDPEEALRTQRGDRVALGLDLEWEDDSAETPPAGPAGGYERACRVTGEVLVGAERIDIDAPGTRQHRWGQHDWGVTGGEQDGLPAGSTVVHRAPLLIAAPGIHTHLERVVVRHHDGRMAWHQWSRPQPFSPRLVR